VNLFSIIKLAQNENNIISYVRQILNKNPDELAAAGVDAVKFDRLKNIASKNSMSELSLKDLAVLSSLPASLKTADFNIVKKHAIDFVNKKTNDEFASALADTPSQRPEEVAPVVKQAPKKKQRVITPVLDTQDSSKITKEIKQFLTFEFLDKSDSKNWKQLIVSPKDSNFNRELISIFANLGVLFETKLNNGQTQNIISSITKEQYKSLLDILKSRSWDISTADPDATSHLFALKEKINLSTHVEIVARSVQEETRGNWMYEIKAPNILKKDIKRQSEVVECITFAFVGMTDDLKYTKEITDEAGNLVPRKRLCKVRGGTDIQATSNGWFVRGDPSDFQRFADLCNTRKVDNSQLASLVIADFSAGKFYDPKKKKNVDPKLARFEGIIDGDGYKSEEDFIKEVELVAGNGLKSKQLAKNPDADTSKLKPYPMQVDGIKFLYSRTHAILGDDTGVGKTMQAIVAGNLRLKADSSKINKDMKAVVLTKSSVVPQFKKDISYFTGIPESDIWTGDELFDDLMKYDHPTKILDAQGNPRISVPKWKWCILNYEKFAIPPRPNIIRNVIGRKQGILDAYLAIMNKAHAYVPQFAAPIFEEVQKATSSIKNKKSQEYINAIRNAANIYIQKNIKIDSPSLYLNSKDSSWYDQKEISNHIDSLARATAFNVLQVALNFAKSASSIQALIEKAQEYILNAKSDKQDSINKFIARQELRLQRTSELDDILYRLSSEDLPEDVRYELEKERDLLERIKGSRSGGLNWGEDGKRNILTAYFSALSKLGVLNVVILDEVHTVKNGNPDDRAENYDDEHDANFTTFNTQIVTNGANNVWGASATIVANKEQDLYNQLRAINSPLGDMNYGDFVSEISNTLSSSRDEKEISTGTAIRDVLVQSKIYLQRSKNDIVAQDPSREPLPPQISHTKETHNPELIDYFMQHRSDEIEQAKMRGTLEGRNAALVMYGINRRSLAKAKAPATIQFALENLRQGQRVGIFTDNIDAGNMIKHGIEKGLKEFQPTSPFFNKKAYFLYGGQDPWSRLQHVDMFMKNEEKSPYAAMVISFNAGGTGLSMENSANVVIFNDLPQTPVLDTQAKGRFYRINSVAPSNVYYMVLPVEEDEKLYDILQRKIMIADQISKLRLNDIQEVMHGNARSEFRIRILMEIAKLEAEQKAIEAEERLFKKKFNNAIGSTKKASYQSWYKNATSCSWSL